ncbi:MAG TPA: hypothetical protein VKB53_05010 [Gammaproteobacteria bacterium]|nr:hypothetical protein [Gammaproteobacteria bacterium]HKH20246.1 hypothetical protein [Gammaproteobacteria bacterium]
MPDTIIETITECNKGTLIAIGAYVPVSGAIAMARRVTATGAV